MNTNPSIPTTFILTNPLDGYWHLAFNPGYLNYVRFDRNLRQVRTTFPRLIKCVAPIVYVGGMIGYAVSIPVRVGYLAGAILRFAWCDGRSLSDRFSEILQAIAGIVSSILGVVCPLVGYQMDRWIYPGDNDPVVDQIRDGVANERFADQRVRRAAAVAGARAEAERRVAQEANRIAELEEQLATRRAELAGLPRMLEGVAQAENERDLVVADTVAAAAADANDRVDQLQRELTHRMQGAEEVAIARRHRLQTSYPIRFENFRTSVIAYLRGFALREVQKESQSPGTSRFLDPNREKLGVGHLVPLFHETSLNLLRDTFGADSAVVQGASAGTNREAKLIAWLLVSMDREGCQLPSPLMRLLSQALIGQGDGFGMISKDYFSVLERLHVESLQAPGGVERLLRGALDPNEPHHPLRLQLGRIVVQLIRVYDRLMLLLAE